MCSADVPEGVCSEISSQAWRQAVLQTLCQHPAVSQSRPFNEGSHQSCTVLLAILFNFQILVYTCIFARVNHLMKVHFNLNPAMFLLEFFLQ